MTKYEELQSQHQRLLTTVGEDKGAAHLSEVQAFIERAKSDAQYVPNLSDRAQLRAILRYWGSWVYERSGVFPDTTLLPARETPPQGFFEKVRARVGGWLWVAGIAVLLVLLLVVALALLNSAPTAALPAPQATQMKGTANANGTAVALVNATSNANAAASTSVAEQQRDLAATAQMATRQAGSQPAAGAPSATPTAITAGGEKPATFTPNALPTMKPIKNTALPTTIPFKRTLTVPLATPTPLPTLPFLPPSGGGGGGLSYIPATVTARSSADCQKHTLILNSTGDLAPAGAYVPPAQLKISLANSGDVVYSGDLPFDQHTPQAIPLNPRDANQAYLVKVEYPVPFEALIVTFPADCSRNEVTITYDFTGLAEQYADFSNKVRQEASQPVSMDWKLVNWGPVGDSGQWTATFQLESSGASPYATYWSLLDKTPAALPNQQMVVVAEDCNPAYLLASISSQGHTATEEVHLSMVEASCPQ